MSMNMTETGAAAVTPEKPAEAPAAAPPAAWPPGLLMENLQKLGGGKPLDTGGIRIWGYVESSFTGRLTGGQNLLPGRLYDARRPNNLRLNQLDLTVDRPYDATKSVDWGFRVDGLFGGDAMLTHARGLFDHAGEGQSDAWADLLQFYGQVWFKTGAESGLEVTFGKFLELAGSESASAVLNPLYSHSYIYTFAEPTTHTGVMAKYIVNGQLFGYLGAVAGWDVFRDNNDSATIISGGGWSSKEQVGGHARTQVLLNIITGPEQRNDSRDYRNLTDIVINYWWTEKLSESLNFDWVTEENVPGVGRANAYGLAHYLTYTINDYVSATWRAEWFRDPQGVRTGTAANYYGAQPSGPEEPAPAARVAVGCQRQAGVRRRQPQSTDGRV
jgi:hypothetical protein